MGSHWPLLRCPQINCFLTVSIPLDQFNWVLATPFSSQRSHNTIAVLGCLWFTVVESHCVSGNVGTVMLPDFSSSFACFLRDFSVNAALVNIDFVLVIRVVTSITSA